MLFRSIPARAALFLCCVAPAASGQTLTGNVSTEDGSPAIGAIVVLVDSTGKSVAGALVGSSGQFLVRAPRAGPYSVRIDQIAKASIVAHRLYLPVGAPVERNLIATASSLELPRVVVRSKGRCVSRPQDEAAELGRVWEEIRKALTATSLTLGQRLLNVRVTLYTRDLDRTGRVRAEQRSERQGLAASPFVSIPAQQLALGGFIQTNAAGTWYYAPDGDVLTADAFLEGYCFSLTRPRSGEELLIGLAFEPARANKLPGIKGTLWIDPVTAELRNLDFTYVRLPVDVASEKVGGRLEFQRLPTGQWLIQRWYIRMPAVQIREHRFRRMDDLGPEARREQVLTGFREEGGEITEVIGVRGTKRFSGRVGEVVGKVYDSTRATPLSGARVTLEGTSFFAATKPDGSFALSGIPEGEYTMAFSHPALDSLGIIVPGSPVRTIPGGAARVELSVPSAPSVIAVLCGESARNSSGVLVTGSVRDQAGVPIAGADVRARWVGNWKSDNTNGFRGQEREISTRTDAIGYYRLCGAAPDLPLEIRGSLGKVAAASVTLQPSGARLVVRDLAVRLPEASAPVLAGNSASPALGSAGGATAIGVVLTDKGIPIEAAEVRLVGSGSVFRTDEQGRFRLERLPAGSHVLDVRRLGYRARRTELSLKNGEAAIVTIRLEPAGQELVAVNVFGEGSTVPGFDERRRRFPGLFIARERIERERPFLLTDLLRADPGIRLHTVRSLMGVDYIVQMRRASTIGTICPVTYYLNGSEFEPSEAGINQDFRPAEIEALEVYQPSQVPAQFSTGRSSLCGVVVIWTRER